MYLFDASSIVNIIKRGLTIPLIDGITKDAVKAVYGLLEDVDEIVKAVTGLKKKVWEALHQRILVCIFSTDFLFCVIFIVSVFCRYRLW